jgi:hypothetical protein
MENIAPIRIQIISIMVSLCFLLYVGYLVIKGKLSVEYSVVWIVSAATLILFSFWRTELETLAQFVGIYSGLSLAFAGAIFAMLIYLLHLSIVATRLSAQNKALAQRLALLETRIKDKMSG